MKLLCGLGNPGQKYIWTRHNVGFLALDFLIPSVKDWSLDKEAAWAEVDVAGEKCLLLKPLTFMNLSGKAVAFYTRRYSIKESEILVICDDADLDFGILRMRPSGGHGGHNGLRSITECLGSDQYARLRVGVGRGQEESLADYVLSSFSQEQKGQLGAVLKKATLACESWVRDGVAVAASHFNGNALLDKG